MSLRVAVDRLLCDQRWTERRRLLRAFAKSPAETGAVAPSSRELAALMAAEMGLDRAETVVELGAGTGVVTEAIAARAARDAVIIALELNPGLAKPLVARFPMLHIVNECAERLPEVLRDCGRDAADAILSALPWASFPPDRQERLLDAIVLSLRRGGRFCAVAYLHAAWLPAGRGFRHRLERRFSSVSTTEVVWGNLPPAFVYRCR